MRVLTYGATGTQGAPVARRLATSPHRVRALVRDPDGAAATELAAVGVEVVPGDLDDAASVAAATRGVDAVAFHLPLAFDLEQGLAQARNVIDAAWQADVKLVVFNAGSLVPDEPSGALHLDLKRGAEAHLREVGVPAVVLRPRLYFEVLSAPWIRDGMIAGGTLAYPLAAEAQASWCAVDDVARLTVAALQRPELAGSVLEVGGPEPLDGAALAAALSGPVGRPLRYHALAVADFERGLQQSLGERVGTVIAESFHHFERCGPRGLVVPDARRTAESLGVALTPLAAWAARQDWSSAVSSAG